MNSTRWFRTAGGDLYHAAKDGAARCSRRFSAEGVTTYSTATLPGQAALCGKCIASLDAEAAATAHIFEDWDGDGTRLELVDNADSISVHVSLPGNGSVELNVGVRIRPQDLDRLEDWISQVRRERGI